VTIPIQGIATLAHELAHALFCGDEYATTQAVAPATALADLDTFWNLQSATEVNDPTTPLDVNRIRWLWPQVTAAGIMNSPLNRIGTSNTFSVQMLSAHADGFAVNDMVRFRPADLLTRSGPSVILQFTPPQSLFKVGARDNNDKNTLLLTIVSPSADVFASNNPSAQGMILYVPVLDASNADTMIIHPTILNFLKGGPLTRKSGACTPTAGSSGDPQIPVRLPTGLQRPRDKGDIIGLYDGGRGYRCGIFHGAGHCIMRRSSWIDDRGKVGGKIHVTRFCHVCRYLIVDRIDPRRHAEIQKSFTFPEFKS
jgi:hypothetical protein